jgi:hypothetical protein
MRRAPVATESQGGGTANAGQSASYQDNGIAHLSLLLEVAERVTGAAQRRARDSHLTLAGIVSSEL